MLKNKIIVRKIRNIVILFMAIIIMFGAYRNIRESKAENVIEISMEVTDKDNALGVQTITAEATEMRDGTYLLDLPESVNGNLITKYYTSDGTEVLFDLENPEPTLVLTEDEVTNQKVQIETTYDKKEVTLEGQTEPTILYKKELKYNEEVIITGYMPLNAELEAEEVDVKTLTNVKLSAETQTAKKAYEFSIFEMVEKEVAEEEQDVTKVEGQNETEGEEKTEEETQTTEPVEGESTEETQNEELENEKEKVEYDPSVYEETLDIEIKYKQENENVSIYSLNENNEATQIETIEVIDGVIFTTSTVDKYIVATETIEVKEENIEQPTEGTETNGTETPSEGETPDENEEGTSILAGDDGTSMLAASSSISLTLNGAAYNGAWTNGDVKASVSASGGIVGAYIELRGNSAGLIHRAYASYTRKW